LVIAVGIPRGDGFGGAASGSLAATTALTVLVSAAAPTPAAFMKFRREYSIVKPPQTRAQDSNKGEIREPATSIAWFVIKVPRDDELQGPGAMKKENANKPSFKGYKYPEP
jgi:hypothetical protein